MYSVFGALRNLWQKCENCDRATTRRNTITSRKKHRNIRSKTIEGIVATAGNGINTCTNVCNIRSFLLITLVLFNNKTSYPRKRFDLALGRLDICARGLNS